MINTQSPVVQMLVMGLSYGSIAALVAFFLAPLQFLKTIKQESGQAYGAILGKVLATVGWPALFRGALPYAMTNFTSSMAFGLAEYLSIHLFKVEMLCLPVAILVRTTLGGILETILSAYVELQALVKNKGGISVSNTKLLPVFAPILLRNIIFWYGSVIGHLLSTQYHCSLWQGAAIALALGILCSLGSITFDIVVTQIWRRC